MSGDLETFERKIGGGLHGACQLTASGRGKKQSDSQLWLEVGSGGKKKAGSRGVILTTALTFFRPSSV